MDLGLAQHVPTNPNWCHGTLSQLLPLTGLSCSLDRCHADLDQDQAAPAVSQWNTVGLPLDPDADSNHPMDFGISPKPPTAYPARTLRNWATPAGAPKDNLGGVRAFPQEQAATSPRAQEPKNEHIEMSASASTKSGPRAWATWGFGLGQEICGFQIRTDAKSG